MEFGKYLIGIHNNELIDLKSLNEFTSAKQQAKQKKMEVVAIGGKSIKIVPRRNFLEKITAFFSGQIFIENRNLKNLRIALSGDHKAGVQQLHRTKGSAQNSSSEKLFQDTLNFLVDDIRKDGQHQTLLRSIQLGRTPEANHVRNSVGLNDGYVVDPERKFKSSTGNGPLRTVNLEIINILKIKQTLNSLSNIKVSTENTNLKNKLEPLFAAASKLGQTQLLGIDGLRPVGSSESIKDTLDKIPRDAILNKLEEVATVIGMINSALIGIIDGNHLIAQNSVETNAQLMQIHTRIDRLSQTPNQPHSFAPESAKQNSDTQAQDGPINLEDIKIEISKDL